MGKRWIRMCHSGNQVGSITTGRTCTVPGWASSKLPIALFSTSRGAIWWKCEYLIWRLHRSCMQWTHSTSEIRLINNWILGLQCIGILGNSPCTGTFSATGQWAFHECCTCYSKAGCSLIPSWNPVWCFLFDPLLFIVLQLVTFLLMFRSHSCGVLVAQWTPHLDCMHQSLLNSIKSCSSVGDTRGNCILKMHLVPRLVDEFIWSEQGLLVTGWPAHISTELASEEPNFFGLQVTNTEATLIVD